MSPHDLVEFFNTFGGGGKSIGGPHENFGVGAKTSLFPWNPDGVVVISWRDCQPAMIWVQRNPETGEYGLKIFDAQDPATGEVTFEHVVTPFSDADNGCDWSLVGPDWVREHGTVLVLLGSGLQRDTVRGDPGRAEADIKGISAYLNCRIWILPPDVEIFVDGVKTDDRDGWPRTIHDRRKYRRKILGARSYIQYEGGSLGKLADQGIVDLKSGVRVRWFLWSGERPAVQSYAAVSGYIAVLYENELYDLSFRASLYRAFGITEAEVRKNVWLVIEPPPLDREGRHGIYPRTDRNSLLMRQDAEGGEPLPLADWGAEFSYVMPEPILQALRKARSTGSGSIKDETWRERLAERFGALWKILRLQMRSVGQLSVNPIQASLVPRPVVTQKPTGGAPGGDEGGRGGSIAIGKGAGQSPATRTRVAGGIPTYVLVRAQDMDEPYLLAAWQPNHPVHPEGAVLINVEHPVLEDQVTRWQAMYPDHLGEAIRGEVVSVYGEIAVAKVAHSEQLKVIMPRKVIEDELRSCSSLTMALLGLMAEEALLASRIGGKFGRKRLATAD